MGTVLYIHNNMEYKFGWFRHWDTAEKNIILLSKSKMEQWFLKLLAGTAVGRIRKKTDKNCYSDGESKTKIEYHIR